MDSENIVRMIGHETGRHAGRYLWPECSFKIHVENSNIPGPRISESLAMQGEPITVDVDSVIIHTPRWTPQGMRYLRVWIFTEVQIRGWLAGWWLPMAMYGLLRSVGHNRYGL